MSDNKKNRAAGVYVSFGVHVIALLIGFFIVAWTEPDPPLPEYGIEFSLGNDILKESQSDPVTSVQKVDEIEQSTDAAESQSNDVESKMSNPDDVPIEENPEESKAAEESANTEDVNSSDLVKEAESSEDLSMKAVKEKGTGADIKPIIEDKSDGTKKEGKKVEEPKIDNRAIYKKNSSTSAAGNKGASLDLSGWMWDFKPQPNDKSDESGKIVFQITVDDEGEIINVRTIEKTISPVLERIYRDAVMELTFSPTADNRSIAPTSTGRITFIIQSR